MLFLGASRPALWLWAALETVQGQPPGEQSVLATGPRLAQSGCLPGGRPAVTANTSWSGLKRPQLWRWFGTGRGVVHLRADGPWIGSRPVLTIAGASCPADRRQHAWCGLGAGHVDAGWPTCPKQPILGCSGTGLPAHI